MISRLIIKIINILPSRLKINIARAFPNWILTLFLDSILRVRVWRLGRLSLRGQKTGYWEFFDVAPGEDVLDVGAGVGKFTLFAAGKAGKIVAIEPHPLNLVYLYRNIRDLKNVRVVAKAAWHRKDVLKLYVSTSPLAHSLFPSATKSVKYRSIEVQADTIDNIVRQENNLFTFLKINVEGAEIEVLKGATEVLGTCRKVIIEAHHERCGKKTSKWIRRFLKERGFRLRLKGDIIYAWKD